MCLTSLMTRPAQTLQFSVPAEQQWTDHMTRRFGDDPMKHPLFGDIETLGPWTAYIRTMDQALAERDPDASVRAWRQAYSAALSDPGWLGLLTVATASLRLREFPGCARGAVARARETYWIAFFRARQQRSLDGVLSAAVAFDSLGDCAAFEQSMRVAEVFATRTGEAAAVDRVRVFIERLADQTQMAKQEP
jgi:hypothetical protein